MFAGTQPELREVLLRPSRDRERSVGRAWVHVLLDDAEQLPVEGREGRDDRLHGWLAGGRLDHHAESDGRGEPESLVVRSTSDGGVDLLEVDVPDRVPGSPG